MHERGTCVRRQNFDIVFDVGRDREWEHIARVDYYRAKKPSSVPAVVGAIVILVLLAGIFGGRRSKKPARHTSTPNSSQTRVVPELPPITPIDIGDWEAEPGFLAALSSDSGIAAGVTIVSDKDDNAILVMPVGFAHELRAKNKFDAFLVDARTRQIGDSYRWLGKHSFYQRGRKEMAIPLALITDDLFPKLRGFATWSQKKAEASDSESDVAYLFHNNPVGGIPTEAAGAEFTPNRSLTMDLKLFSLLRKSGSTKQDLR